MLRRLTFCRVKGREGLHSDFRPASENAVGFRLPYPPPGFLDCRIGSQVSEDVTNTFSPCRQDTKKAPFSLGKGAFSVLFGGRRDA